MSDRKLTRAEQQELLRIARTTLTAELAGREPPALTNRFPRLADSLGVFVTLTRRGELRGCIGYVQGVQPLYRAVREMAHAAAFEDPRFPPMTAGELDGLAIEITVLGPLKRIVDPAAVVVGTHGLVIRQGYCQGLLLPQVPVEQGWDRPTFLSQTCLKAGLPPDAWKRGAEMYVFTGQVFGEKETRSGK